jgi:hypothetical protein
MITAQRSCGYHGVHDFRAGSVPPRQSRPGLRVDRPEDTEGPLCELIDGSLYVTPSADAPHQMLCFDLGLVLAPRLPAGLRVAPRVNAVVREQTLVIPDVAVIDPDHLTHRDLGVTPSGLALLSR